MNQIKISLFLSFYTLLFLGIPKYGNVFQLISLSFILLQNILTLVGLSKNKVNTFGSSQTLFPILLVVFVPLLSLLNNFINPTMYYVEYSFLFLVVIVSIYFAVNTIDFQVIFNSFVWAGIAITLTILATGMNELHQALSMNIDPETGLSRFSPLGLHPNLVGHIFGGLAVTFFCAMLYGKGFFVKVFFTTMIGISVLFCLAASSRGGLIAAVSGVVAIYSVAIWSDKMKRKYFFMFFSIFMLLMFFAGGPEKIIGQIASMLEINTSDRGIDSGLTGRIGNWAKLVSTVAATSGSLFIGNGLRSGGFEVLGYEIDNGYLNMLYESGLVIAAGFATLMIINANRLRVYLLRSPTMIKAVVFGLFIFILLESIVARYLLSIGNPISLFIIFCIFGLANICKSSVPQYRLIPQNFRAPTELGITKNS